ANASFALTNTLVSTTTALNATAPFRTSPQGVTLTATVTAPSGTVNAGTVTFTVLHDPTVIGSAVTSGTVTAGRASISYVLPASTAPGGYTIQADYSGGGSFAPSRGTATLTIGAAPLVAIAVTPSTVTLKVGQSQTFTAMGTYADNSTADLTSAVTWTS